MHNMPSSHQIATTNNSGGEITMSSREIAELTGKRHDHILRDIEKMLQDIADPKFGASDFLSSYTDSTGRSLKEYRLPKDLTVTLVTGYRADLRYKVVKKLEYLEGQQAPLDYSNPAVVLGVIGHLQEKVLEQQGRLKKLDRLEGAQGSMCISDAAKTLGVQRKWLFDFMSSRRWIFKRSGNKNWLAYDDKRKALLLEHDDHLYMDDLGQERVSTRVLVTAKGLVRLAELIEQPLH
ncbi:Rha family transcriptional regulator [Brucella intermedia]|uniref:Rha family transcriptional regulator n=1 Tax=Brucella intermedia TaxID=94625 RepID=UPI0023617E80|nr:phage regulatory protein/antirepressor Ant [Brucella intermedia]